MSEPLDIRLSFRFGETDKHQLDEICEDTGLDAFASAVRERRSRDREIYQLSAWLVFTVAIFHSCLLSAMK